MSIANFNRRAVCIYTNVYIYALLCVLCLRAAVDERIDNALNDTHEYLNLFLTPRLTIEAAEIASLSSDDWSPRTVMANGENRMRLSSRLIRGAVNPTKIFVRIRFTTSTEREKQSKRNRERERERGEAAILIKRRSTSFCATQFRRKERLGGCVYLNARFGGKRLSR